MTRTTRHTFLNPSRVMSPVSKVRPGESMPEKGRWPNTQSPGLLTNGESSMDIRCKNRRPQTSLGGSRTAASSHASQRPVSANSASMNLRAHWTTEEIESMIMSKIVQATRGGNGFMNAAFKVTWNP